MQIDNIRIDPWVPTVQLRTLMLIIAAPAIDRTRIDDRCIAREGPVSTWPRRAGGAQRPTSTHLRGEPPAELPVQAPVKYEMVINLRLDPATHSISIL